MDGQRTVVATLATLAEAVEREEIGAPALIVDRPRGRAAARRSPGSSAGRCTVAASSSPAPAPRPAAWRRRCAGSAREVVELPAIRIEPPIETDEVAPGGRRRSTAYALVCLTSPNGVAAALRGDGRRRARRPRAGRRDGRRDRAGHRAGAGRARHRRRRRSPSASSPRRWSRRSPRSRSRASGSSSPAPPRPATSSPTPCASAAPRSTSSPSTRRSARSPSRTRSRRPSTPTTSPSPPPPPCAT